MNMYDDGRPTGLSYSDIRNSKLAAIAECEQLIIKHIELATGKKHIVVDGEDRYIPLEEAIKLGLTESPQE